MDTFLLQFCFVKNGHEIKKIPIQNVLHTNKDPDNML